VKTFAAWRKEGWAVKRGEKSTCRNEKGEALFSLSQVANVKTVLQAIKAYSPEPGIPGKAPDLEFEIRKQMVGFGGYMTDLDLFIEGDLDQITEEDEPDHWVHMRPY